MEKYQYRSRSGVGNSHVMIHLDVKWFVGGKQDKSKGIVIER